RQAAANLASSGFQSLLTQALTPTGGGGGGGLLGSFLGGVLSFSGGGFTGNGSRTGGIDGEGGFPAILHPNETVIDHTKQSAGAGETSQVMISLSPELIGQILQQSQGQAIQIASISAQQQRQALPSQLQTARSRGLT
ncbi:MAG: hypothetical protein AAF709_25770, partial [Pseudomonadota bacterium]